MTAEGTSSSGAPQMRSTATAAAQSSSGAVQRPLDDGQ
jgi:hypothetical protein